MLKQENFPQYISEVVNEGKAKACIDGQLGLNLRELHKWEFGSTHSHYPEVEQTGWLLYPTRGIENADACITAYRNRLLYASLRQTLLSTDEFKLYARSEISKNIKEKFSDDELLSRLANALED